MENEIKKDLENVSGGEVIDGTTYKYFYVGNIVEIERNKSLWSFGTDRAVIKEIKYEGDRRKDGYARYLVHFLDKNMPDKWVTAEDIQGAALENAENKYLQD